MSKTRDKIIQKLKDDPENGADAFIKLQKELTIKTAEHERLREAVKTVTSDCKLVRLFNVAEALEQALSTKENKS